MNNIMDKARTSAKQMIYKLEYKGKPDINEDYKEMKPLVINPPETFKKRGAVLGPRQQEYYEEVDLVPNFIPLYYKIAVKDCNGPIRLSFEYSKAADPNFSALKSDLWVFVSESEPMPQNYFLKNQGIDE